MNKKNIHQLLTVNCKLLTVNYFNRTPPFEFGGKDKKSFEVEGV